MELSSVSDFSQRPVVNANFGDPDFGQGNWYNASCCYDIGKGLFEFTNTNFERTDPPLIGKIALEKGPGPNRRTAAYVDFP